MIKIANGQSLFIGFVIVDLLALFDMNGEMLIRIEEDLARYI